MWPRPSTPSWHEDTIHRDLKPENVVLDRNDEDGLTRYKLIDWATPRSWASPAWPVWWAPSSTLHLSCLSQEYTKSVDLEPWAPGARGDDRPRPLLPDLSGCGQWVEHVEKKNPDVICIRHEPFSDEHEEQIVYETELQRDLAFEKV